MKINFNKIKKEKAVISLVEIIIMVLGIISTWIFCGSEVIPEVINPFNARINKITEATNLQIFTFFSFII